MLATALPLAALVVAAPEDVERTSRRAKALYAGGHFAAAADLFDDLWQSTHDPRYLYNAAFAHEAAGEDVDALADFSRYLAVEAAITEVDRLDVRVHAGTLKERLSPIVVEIAPAALAEAAVLVVAGATSHTPLELDVAFLERGDDGASRVYLAPGEWSVSLRLPAETAPYYRLDAGARVTVAAPDDRQSPRVTLRPEPRRAMSTLRLGPEDALRRGVEVTFEDRLGVEPPQTTTISAATTAIPLRAGPWRATMRPSGRRAEAVHRDLVVTEDGGTLEVLDLEPGVRLPRWLLPRDDDDRRRRLTVGASFGALGLALLGGGLAGIGVARARRRDGVIRWGDEPSGGYDADARGSLLLNRVGGGLLGAAIGSEVVALSGAAGPRPRVWITEAATGGVLTIGGAVWHGLAASAQASQTWDIPPGNSPYEAPRASVDDFKASLSGSALILGAGVSLLVGASAAYLLTRWSGRVRGAREAVLSWRSR